jgi:Ca-activated chloride channel family protein
MILEENSYLYFLFLLPVLILLFLWMQNWKKKAISTFGDAQLVEKLAPKKSFLKEVIKTILFLTSIFLIIIGLSNPKMGTKTETLKTKGIEILFAIDVSKSMLAEDVAPNRLEKSKQIASQIINKLQGDRIGIIAYSGGAFPVLPITNDYGIAKMYLQTMSPSLISEQGTSIDQAIDLAEKSFTKKSRAHKLLIIISDGEDHSNDAESAAQNAAKTGIKIITVGVGTEKGNPIPLKENGVTQSLQRDKDGNVVITKRNSIVLKSIANATNENYIDGNNTKNVVEFIENRINSYQKTENNATIVASMPSQFQWFLGLGLLLLFVDVFIVERKMNSKKNNE